MGMPISITALDDNVATEHQIVKYPTKEQFNASAGHQAIAQMRAMLGRSGPASRWAGLTEQQRKIVCYGTEGAAGVMPSTHASKSLDEMTIAEREVIRRTLLALQDLVAAFGPGLLDRAEFMRNCKPDPIDPAMEAQKRETINHTNLVKQARSLQARLDAMPKAEGGAL